MGEGAEAEELMAGVACDALWAVAKNLSRRLAGCGFTTELEFKKEDPVQIRKSLGVV
jgi:hypothetical protein